MRRKSSRKGRPDPIAVWQNPIAKYELNEQIKQARPTLRSLAEAFAKADIRPHDATDVRGVVEAIHVKRAADVLFALARTPQHYTKTGSPELFISFASQQRADVAAWIEHLQTAGFRCFFSDESIAYSKDWAEEIWHAVRVCLCFLPIVTPDWIRSRWCMYETGAAVALNKPIVPIIIGAVDVPPPVSDCEGFKLGHVGDLRDLPDEQQKLWHRIRRELRLALARARFRNPFRSPPVQISSFCGNLWPD